MALSGRPDRAWTLHASLILLILFWGLAFVAIFAVPLLKERIGRWQSAGIALAFAGLAVMIFFVRPESQFTFRASEGALTVVPPAIFSALYAVLGKGYLRRYPPFTFVAWTLLIGTVLLIPLLLATGPSVVADLQTMGLAGWAPVLYLGIFPTFVGYGIWFRALERIPAADALERRLLLVRLEVDRAVDHVLERLERLVRVHAPLQRDGGHRLRLPQAVHETLDEAHRFPLVRLRDRGTQRKIREPEVRMFLLELLVQLAHELVDVVEVRRAIDAPDVLLLHRLPGRHR